MNYFSSFCFVHLCFRVIKKNCWQTTTADVIIKSKEKSTQQPHSAFALIDSNEFVAFIVLATIRFVHYGSTICPDLSQ